MARKDDEEPTPSEKDSGVGPDGAAESAGARGDATASGPEDNTSGPGAAGAEQGELTVDDILGAAQSADAAAAEDGVLADLESALLTDLKRLQAEYANYRRRTEEQREIEIERAKGAVAKGFIPVLDDLDRAEKHGDLEEGTPFSAIADKIRTVAERLGVTSYGEAGEVFDPQQHEAIFQQPTPGATETTILEVVEVGYRLGSIELRPAKVVVAVPAE